MVQNNIKRKIENINMIGLKIFWEKISKHIKYTLYLINNQLNKT